MGEAARSALMAGVAPAGFPLANFSSRRDDVKE